MKKRRARSAYEAHISNVYNDKEFQKECLDLEKKFKSRAKMIGLKDTGLPITSITTNDYELKNALDKLSEKYLIHEFFVRRYLNGESDIAGGMYYNSSVLEDIETINDVPHQYILLTLNPYVTYDEFLKLWSEIKSAKKTMGIPLTLKAPLYDDLVYAIFRALQIGLSFPDIHDDYMHGRLMLYPKNPIEFIYRHGINKFIYIFVTR